MNCKYTKELKETIVNSLNNQKPKKNSIYLILRPHLEKLARSKDKSEK